MEVGNENVSAYRTGAELIPEGLPEDAEASAAIEDVKMVSDPHLHTRGVASIAHVFGLRSGC
jgi:hypothetical protein